ncbi:hypothetical protein SNARM312S_01732 [Streptomyces narbonensis]
METGRDGAHGAVPGHGQVVLLDGERVGARPAREVDGRDRRIAPAGGQDLLPEQLVAARRPARRRAVRGRAGRRVRLGADEQDGPGGEPPAR